MKQNMKIKFNHIIRSSIAVLLLSGCANEAPFSSERDNGKNKYGEFHKSALTFNVREENGIQVQTRATSVDIDKFQLSFIKDGKVERTVEYGDMPEVMLLEQGTYTVKASYGADLEVEWDNPFFEGESAEFDVTPKTITSSIDPIVCRLKNVKVSVVFDPELAAVAGDESYIEVKVKNGKGLQFYKNADVHVQKGGGTAGYFRINDETTLIATFHGSIYGSGIEQETKSLADIAAGNHYKMTFSLHSHNGADKGDSNGSVNVDGSVEYENMETNVVIKDQLIDDSERPVEDDPGNNNPGGDDPVTPTPTALEIIPSAGISLDDWNVNPSSCCLTIKSATGVTGFIVDIDSPSLTPAELANVGLASHMDLITGMGTTESGELDLSAQLTGLGLPCKEKVEDQKEIVFDITKFMNLLSALGDGDHTFILNVTDESGTYEKKLRIRIINKDE